MPTTFFANSYGGYAYGNALATADAESAFREQEATPAGRGGHSVGDTLFDRLSLTLEGVLLAADVTNPQSIRDAQDAFLAAHPPGPPRRFVIDDDRYCMAQVKSLTWAKWKGLPSREYSAGLVCVQDPPWFDAQPQPAVALAAGGGATAFVIGGSGPAAPVLTLTVSAAPAGGLVTVTDAAGNAYGLAPDAAGTFVLDALAERVTLADGTDKGALFQGQFLSLPPGAATWTVTLSGGAALSAASVQWQNRWY